MGIIILLVLLDLSVAWNPSKMAIQFRTCGLYSKVVTVLPQKLTSDGTAWGWYSLSIVWDLYYGIPQVCSFLQYIFNIYMKLLG